MLPDHLEDNLAVVFVGTSVATASATRGHYYGGPGNKFWELLWEAGLTGERILSPEQGAWVLRYGIGLTDVVKSLAASSDSLLKSTDYDVAASSRRSRRSTRAWSPSTARRRRDECCDISASRSRRSDPAMLSSAHRACSSFLRAPGRMPTAATLRRSRQRRSGGASSATSSGR